MSRFDGQFLPRHFQAGNIIHSAYFGNFDRVIEYHEDGGGSVVVEEVRYEDGRWVKIAPRRSHATYPCPGDRVVA